MVVVNADYINKLFVCFLSWTICSEARMNNVQVVWKLWNRGQTTVNFGVLAFLTKKNVDLRYHNSLCVSEACDRFLLSFVRAVYYISGW